MIGEIFNTLILKPVFNILLLIINYIPGHNFGLAIIIFTTLVSLAIWPSRKKQLHQTKLMQKLQPEIDKIKQNTKGDKQKQQALLMELYKENGINPIGSLGGLIIQLPIFIAVINSVRYLTQDVGGSIAKYGYNFIETGHIKQLAEGSAKLNNHLFGIDLSLFGYHGGKFYLPLVALAILTAALQYIQIKQTMPASKNTKKLKDILGGASQPKPEDISGVMNKNMAFLMPALIGWICLVSQGASSLYFFISALVSIVQQKLLFNKDVEEMEIIQPNAKLNTKKVEVKSVKAAEVKSGSSIKDKLTKKAVERAQNKAYKPVAGVTVRMVGSDSDSKKSSTTSLRGKK